ncbi:HARB1-like protein [Mya arenaria]|uniref:HARB1-like protein n=1 Tax=Mya arenaria TaxID=6604 RepID=A0ABY7E7V7_MYAAR|nr:HARB1-like protein [Mya arenaria]
MKRFIVWPSGEERNRVRSGFFTSTGFPHVVGCADRTHICIQSPSVDEPAYINRKGYRSLNTQAVCNHEGFFTSVNASWRGSCNDAHVFRTSGLCNSLPRDNIRLSPVKACRIATACAILHNVPVLFNMPEVEEGDIIPNIENNVN